jgi:hypothetical protein
MTMVEPTYLARVKRFIQFERRRLANPFIRQRLENISDIAQGIERRVEAIEKRLAFVENRMTDVATGVQNDAQAIAAVALGLQRDMDDLNVVLNDLRQTLSPPAQADASAS